MLPCLPRAKAQPNHDSSGGSKRSADQSQGCSHRQREGLPGILLHVRSLFLPHPAEQDTALTQQPLALTIGFLGASSITIHGLFRVTFFLNYARV